jgi:hypothetical protein
MGYRQPVIDAAMIYGGAGPWEVLAGMPGVRARGFLPPPLADVAEDAPPAVARVNHNRWIADCPDCDGAVDVWRDGPTAMLCPGCLNAVVGHRWRPVAMPGDVAGIEDALMDRALPATRNWIGETPTMLRAEQTRKEGR